MLNTFTSAAVLVLSMFVIVDGIKLKSEGFFEDYFSVSQTRSIKGMCAIFVMLHHMCAYLGDTFTSLNVFKYVGVLMVSGFFLVSGYGLQYGIMNKKDYLRGFFSKRLLALAVPFYIMNIFYIITYYHSDTRSILLTFTGYHVWYIPAIAIFYICFYICGKLFGAKRVPAAMTVVVFLYMLVMNRLHFGFWWYNSCPALAVGIWVCYGKEAFTNFFKQCYRIKTMILMSIFMVSYTYYHLNADDTTFMLFTMTAISTTSFALLLVVLSMKVQFHNSVLRFCGDVSLEWYLAHLPWVTWFSRGFWHDLAPSLLDNKTIYFAAIFVGTAVTSVLVHKISGLILKVFNRNPNKGVSKTVTRQFRQEGRYNYRE